VSPLGDVVPQFGRESQPGEKPRPQFEPRRIDDPR
jgi:hypothetical protein